MITVTFIIILIYVLLIGSFIYGFDKVPDFKLEDIPAKTKFSVIIPFRNEAKNLPHLLTTIASLNYPKQLFEIIFVDDASQDTSVEIINSYKLKGFNVSVIKNNRTTNAPKKDAITTAIHHSKHEWIVTTDADCLLPKFWLDTYDNFLQIHDAKLLIAPVTLNGVSSFFERFQLLDFLSLQGVTIGSFGIKKPFLCNGANLAYNKAAFNKVNGFEGNTHIASGDDIFLLEKITALGENAVQYIKSNDIIVSTKPMKTFNDLKSQRVRWASKTSKYNSLFSKLTAIIVLFTNGALVCLPLLCLANVISTKTLVYSVFIKWLIDFLLIFKSARFFDQSQFLPSYFLSCILYPFFSLFIAPYPLVLKTNPLY